MFGQIRNGFSMKILNGVNFNRPDLHILAAELGVTTRDVLIKDGTLTIYNTSETCQELVDDNALVAFVAMTLEIPKEHISELTAVEEEPVKLEFDLDMFDDDDD